jgi:CBS domain-containing protein
VLTIRIQPEEGVALEFQAKRPGLEFVPQTVAMDFSYQAWFKDQPAAYERLLHDAMVGDTTLFIRQDTVERAWEIVTPLLENPGPIHEYTAGTWSDAAAELIAPRKWWPETGRSVTRVGELMSEDVFTVTPDTTISDVADTMVKEHFGSAVVTEGKDIAGIITERDLLRAAASGADFSTAKASEWMTADVVTCSPGTDAETAAEKMTAGGFRHLPAIANGELVGIVSLRDVLSARIQPRERD